MGKQAQAIEFSTELGINYIPCWAIVLMLPNIRIDAMRILYCIDK